MEKLKHKQVSQLVPGYTVSKWHTKHSSLSHAYACTTVIKCTFNKIQTGLLCWLSDKELPANTGDRGLIPGSGRSLGGKENGNQF